MTSVGEQFHQQSLNSVTELTRVTQFTSVTELHFATVSHDKDHFTVTSLDGGDTVTTHRRGRCVSD